jgi:hypothetical protein
VLARLTYGNTRRLQGRDRAGGGQHHPASATAINQTQIDNAKRNRVNAALLLTLVSPEFIVQP